MQTSTVQVNTTLSDKEKGDAFEKYILSLFDRASGRFRLLDWRSDKITESGLYALSNHSPDLALDFKDNGGYHKFAIECKWRSSFYNGTIDWAKEYQIKNYLNYQKRENIPVFIAIGVGGAPNAPDNLYVARLNDIARYPSIYQSTLKKYERNPKHKFFYNPEHRKLS
ncbi:MAG: hypothetical protein ICV79_10165 [Flavisolibacter sp.]|nr:hypothetical protein [Flavisolibacter sp.]